MNNNTPSDIDDVNITLRRTTINQTPLMMDIVHISDPLDIWRLHKIDSSTRLLHAAEELDVVHVAAAAILHSAKS
jgi:hypothetical protein